MSNALAIVRAYGGEPLVRVVLSVEKGLVYARRPLENDGENESKTPPIGFPATDVFEMDENRYRALADQWGREKRTAPELWSSARPFKA